MIRREKVTIWLAGDSTMQTYSEEQRPQYGWGEFLINLLEPEAEIRCGHREDCPFGQEMRYEGSLYIVDNCAMAGRSSKTFREEGRLQDIAEHIQEGDYLFLQFGHNDAGEGKPERYVPLEQFQDSLAPYIQAAQQKGATPVLISSITLLPCRENEQGGAGAVAALLPQYAAKMQEYAKRLAIPYIDMHQMTRDYCRALGDQASTLYREDRVHLVQAGALAYAKLLYIQKKEIVLL